MILPLYVYLSRKYNSLLLALSYVCYEILTIVIMLKLHKYKNKKHELKPPLLMLLRKLNHLQGKKIDQTLD
uniref:Uncharacterized protein n=1 Tax=Solanum tuberosum TaxID=4113 RepID=M1CNZ2_SOLTU